MSQLPGVETERSIMRALDDLFGPSVREAGLWLADWVREKRGERLSKTVRQAAAVASERGNQGYRPPLKFLTAYMDRASVEEDDSLNTMWAELLVSASTDYTSGHPLFVETLGKLDGAAAGLFDRIVQSPQRKSFKLSQLVDVDFEGRTRDFSELIELCFEGDRITECVLDRVGRYGFALWRLHAYEVDKAGDYEDTIEEFTYENGDRLDLQLSVLELAGLLNSRTVHYRNKFSRVDAQFVWITTFGAEFFFATHDPVLRKPPGLRPFRPDGYPDD